MSKAGYLTAAEYKALRQLLGFTQAEVQEFHGVQNMRTIKRWENGSSRVSQLACDKILDLFEKVNLSISAALEEFEKLPKETQKEMENVLIVYPDSCYKKFAVGFENLPNSVHRAMTTRFYSELKLRGAEVGIVEFNPQDYFIFLGKKGMTDNQASRCAWASDYRFRIFQEYNNST